jgi:isocitrate/isopropylmalate dehydrogenase
MLGDMGGVLVTSAATGAMLLPLLHEHIQPPQRTGRLLFGESTAIAMPAHGELSEQVEWGFANPLATFRALIALLRYHWADDASARRIEDAINVALRSRRTPDMGGLHTMYELTRAILRVLAEEQH